MAQVSYGTITITDTNDIEQIYMVYAGSESNVTPPDVNDFALWKTDVTQTSGTYIWQRTVVKKSGIEITAMNFQQFYGEPVCVTGDGGRSIKSITTYYCNYGTGTPEENYSGWNIDTPEYDEDKPNYWVKTVIIYVDDSEEEFELNGDIVTFEDGEHKHLTSFTATINPKQDLHGYDKPWVGGAGANKWDEEWELGAISVTGENATSSTEIRSKNYIPVVGGQTYYLYCAVPSTFNYRFYDADKNFISGAYIGRNNTLLIPNDARYMRFFMGAAYGTTYNHDIAINYPSSVTTYSPYSNICPISGWDSVEATLAGDNLVDDTLRNYTNTVTLPVGTWYAQAFIYATSEINTRLDYINENGNWASVLSSPFETSTFTTEGNYTFGWAYPAGAKPKTMTLNVTKPTTFRFNTASLNNTRRLSLSRVRKTSISDFVEYQGGETKVSTLPETVYGGSLDVVNGVLTVDRAMVDLGTLTWTYSNSFFRTDGIVSAVKRPPNNQTKVNAISSAYPIMTWAAISGTDTAIAVDTTGRMIVANPSITSLSDFQTAISDVQLCYELAEPRTIQLTPKQVTTLLGTNNVWADSGDVEISGFTIVGQDVQIHLDTALTDSIAKSVEANANASEALEKANEAESIAAHANEDSQGALSIATGINQHFFSIPSDYSTSVPAGSYITEINVDEFKQSPSGGNLLTRSDGVWLRNGADILASLQGTGLNFLIPTGTYKGRKSLEILGGTTPALKLYDAQNNNAVATLNSDGLVLSKGGIRVNTVGSNNGVYISSENLGSKVTSLDANKINWRAVIGSKFGVDSEGNLYANEAHISGEITASKLTISSNATINDTSGLIRNDAIEVGGRNLALNSKKLSINAEKVNRYVSGYNTTATESEEVEFAVAEATSDWQGLCVFINSQNPKAEEEFCFSADMYTSGGSASISCYLMCYDSTGTRVYPSDCVVDGAAGLSKTLISNEEFTIPRKVSVVFSLSEAAIELLDNGGEIKVTFQAHGFTSGASVYMYAPKLERGTKATDWTPAPEDMESYTDAAIYEVVPQIGEAQTQATEAAKAYSNEILESFSSKFTVSPENISSEVVAIQNGETLVSRINQLPDSVKIEAKNVEIVDRYESYIELAADEANPYILLGKRENNAMLLRITNKRMGFEVNSEEVAYLAPDALHVQKQISFGDFIMKQRENGHLSIIRTTRGGN